MHVEDSVKFAKRNKLSMLVDYFMEISAGNYETFKVLVIDTKLLGKSDFENFSISLLKHREWLRNEPVKNKQSLKRCVKVMSTSNKFKPIYVETDNTGCANYIGI